MVSILILHPRGHRFNPYADSGLKCIGFLANLIILQYKILGRSSNVAPKKTLLLINPCSECGIHQNQLIFALFRLK